MVCKVPAVNGVALKMICATCDHDMSQVRFCQAHWAQLAQILGAKNPDMLRPQIGLKYLGFGARINRFWLVDCGESKKRNRFLDSRNAFEKKDTVGCTQIAYWDMSYSLFSFNTMDPLTVALQQARAAAFHNLTQQTVSQFANIVDDEDDDDRQKRGKCALHPRLLDRQSESLATKFINRS
jgi:hypothetical protein